MRLFLLVFAAGRVAMACSCAPEAYAPLCQRIERMKVLFVGTALETNDNHDGFLKGGLWYRFSVEESYKGLAEGIREVIVDPASGTSCQESFAIGKRYLISSYGDRIADQNAAAVSVGGYRTVEGGRRPAGPIVVTGVCSGSRLVEHAVEDISFARRYRGGRGEGRVFGSVRIHADEWYWSERYPPLAGAVVRMVGPGGVRVATTDQSGRYEIPNVEAGKYVLRAESDGFNSGRPAYEVEVPARGCGVANIGMFSDGGIAGIVVEQDGTPAKNVAVEYLHRMRGITGPRFRDRSTKTDEGGRFRFSKVPPGEFLIGVHIDTAPKAEERIAPTYWPGVAGAEQAEVLRLGVNEKREGVIIRLGARAGVRKIRVRAQWPDGRPAAETDVSARVSDSTAASGKTDGAGSVELTVLEGVEYEIGGRAWTSYRMVHGVRVGAEWVDAEARMLPASSAGAEVVLVLNRARPRE